MTFYFTFLLEIWHSSWPYCMPFKLTLLHAIQLDLLHDIQLDPFAWHSTWPGFLQDIQLDDVFARHSFCMSFNLTFCMKFTLIFCMTFNLTQAFLQDIQFHLPACTTFSLIFLQDTSTNLIFLHGIQLDLLHGILLQAFYFTFLFDILLNLFAWHSTWLLHDIQLDPFAWHSTWPFCMTFNLIFLHDILLYLFAWHSAQLRMDNCSNVQIAKWWDIWWWLFNLNPTKQGRYIGMRFCMRVPIFFFFRQ